MKKLTKRLIVFGCAVIMLFGSGCGSSKQVDEIFQGNYVKVSEETVKDFYKNVTHISDDSEESIYLPILPNGFVPNTSVENEDFQGRIKGLKELIANNGGVSVESSVAVLFKAINIDTTKGNMLQKIDGSYEYRFDSDATNGNFVEYSDGQYCYDSKGKLSHKYSDSCLSECAGGMTGCVAGITELLNNKNIEWSNIQYYMDSVDAKYTKIKIKGKCAGFLSEVLPMEDLESLTMPSWLKNMVINTAAKTKVSEEIVWVYDKDYKWVAYYEKVSNIFAEITGSHTPWSGTIIPPDDLNSYQFYASN